MISYVPFLINSIFHLHGCMLLLNGVYLSKVVISKDTKNQMVGSGLLEETTDV